MCPICGVTDSATVVAGAQAGILALLAVSAVVLIPLVRFAWRLLRLEGERR
jgi:hypothetical protein